MVVKSGSGLYFCAFYDCSRSSKYRRRPRNLFQKRPSAVVLLVKSKAKPAQLKNILCAAAGDQWRNVSTPDRTSLLASGLEFLALSNTFLAQDWFALHLSPSLATLYRLQKWHNSSVAHPVYGVDTRKLVLASAPRRAQEMASISVLATLTCSRHLHPDCHVGNPVSQPSDG